MKSFTKNKVLKYKQLKEQNKTRSCPVDELVVTSKPILPVSSEGNKPDIKTEVNNESAILPKQIIFKSNKSKMHPQSSGNLMSRVGLSNKAFLKGYD